MTLASTRSVEYTGSILTVTRTIDADFVMNVVMEFIYFIRSRKKYWLWPIVVISLLLGALIVFTQGSAIAPFVYTVF